MFLNTDADFDGDTDGVEDIVRESEIVEVAVDDGVKLGDIVTLADAEDVTLDVRLQVREADREIEAVTETELVTDAVVVTDPEIDMVGLAEIDKDAVTDEVVDMVGVGDGEIHGRRTVTGSVRWVVVPSPNWPSTLFPQHFTFPSDNRAQVLLLPPPRLTHGTKSPETDTGAR
jgi:hypothetical protein